MKPSANACWLRDTCCLIVACIACGVLPALPSSAKPLALAETAYGFVDRESDELIRVGGCVTLHAANTQTGEVPPSEIHGTITLRISKNANADRSTSECTATIVAGRWEALVPENAMLTIASLVINDRAAMPERLKISTATTDLSWDVRAAWATPVALRVVSTEKDWHPERVVVVEATSILTTEEENVGHPAALRTKRLVCHNCDLPILLPARTGVRRYWISARGSAWTPISVDHDAGGERVVALEKGLNLRVHVKGAPERSLGVRVSKQVDRENQLVLGVWRVDDDDSLTIEKLPECDLRVELLDRMGSPCARSIINPDLNAENVVSLLCGSGVRVPPEYRDISGSMSIPKCWSRVASSFRMTLRSFDDPSLLRGIATIPESFDPAIETGTSARWRWTIQHVAFGKYYIQADPMQSRYELSVYEGLQEEVDLVAPACGDVRVVVSSPSVGAPATIEWITWHPRIDSARPWAISPAVISLNGGRPLSAQFLAPIGPIEIDVITKEFPPVLKVLDVREGLNECDIVVGMEASVRIDFREANRSVPLLSSDAALIVECITPDLSYQGASWSHPGLVGPLLGFSGNGTMNVLVVFAGSYEPVRVNGITISEASQESIVVPLVPRERRR